MTSSIQSTASLVSKRRVVLQRPPTALRKFATSSVVFQYGSIIMSAPAETTDSISAGLPSCQELMRTSISEVVRKGFIALMSSIVCRDLTEFRPCWRFSLPRVSRSIQTRSTPYFCATSATSGRFVMYISFNIPLDNSLHQQFTATIVTDRPTEQRAQRKAEVQDSFEEARAHGINIRKLKGPQNPTATDRCCTKPRKKRRAKQYIFEQKKRTKTRNFRHACGKE